MVQYYQIRMSAEWASEKKIAAYPRSKEMTEMLRKQVFAEQLAEGKEYTIGEFHDENKKDVTPNMKGWGPAITSSNIKRCQLLCECSRLPMSWI